MCPIGLDLVDLGPTFSRLQTTDGTDVARRAFLVHRLVEPMQNSFTAIEKVSTHLSELHWAPLVTVYCTSSARSQ